MQFEDRALAPYQGSEPYIFLSYSHRDAEAAAEIIRDMNLDGFRIWYDEGLVPGKEWDENIARAIVNCSYFVALMSANYLDSANCRDELNFARDKKLPLLLLYLEDVELPAGMEMRLGRMLAIHTHKFLRKEMLISKIRAAEGITVCRKPRPGEKPEPAEETVPTVSGGGRKPFPVLPVVIAAVLVAAAALFLILGRGGKSAPAPTEPPTAAPVEITAAPEPTIEPVPETAKPTATPEPNPESVEETPEPAEETPEPTPIPEDLPPEEIAYREAEALQAAGKTAPAALAFHKLGDYKDAQERSAALWRANVKQTTVSIGTELSVGLREDGTVLYAGMLEKSKAELSGWGNLIAVSEGNEHTLGLLADGTVISKGMNFRGERDVSGWRNIIAIVAGDKISVGLKADGTVVAVGDNTTGQCDVGGWTDIVAIAVGGQHTVGLKADGTLVTTGYNNNGQRNVEDWTDIVAIAAGAYHTLGVKADGTVVAVGYNAYHQCDVGDWTDIVAVGAGNRHSVGLRADGTVVGAGGTSSVQLDDVKDWTNVIEIDCGELSVIALRDDGTALACGENTDGKCAVDSWKDLRLPAHVLG